MLAAVVLALVGGVGLLQASDSARLPADAVTGTRADGGCHPSTGARQRPRNVLAGSGSQLLFEGDVLSPGVYGFQSSGPGNRALTVEDPAGSDAAVIELRTNERGASGGVVRSQLVAPVQLRAGDEYWQVARIYVDRDFPTGGEWTTIMSSFGPPYGMRSSPTGIRIVRNELVWDTNNRRLRYCVPWRVPLVKGRWIAVARHEKISRRASEGFFEIAYSPDADRVPMVRQTLDNGRKRWYFSTLDGGEPVTPRIANYHKHGQRGWRGTNSIYFGKHRIWGAGTTLDQLNAEYIGTD
jgi:hypothetical protein